MTTRGSVCDDDSQDSSDCRNCEGNAPPRTQNYVANQLRRTRKTGEGEERERERGKDEAREGGTTITRMRAGRTKIYRTRTTRRFCQLT